MKFSKCASKGLDVSFINEYLIETMLNIRLSHSLMNYTQTLKKTRIDQVMKITENFDHILFNLNRFNKVKTIDEDIFHNT